MKWGRCPGGKSLVQCWEGPMSLHRKLLTRTGLVLQIVKKGIKLETAHERQAGTTLGTVNCESQSPTKHCQSTSQVSLREVNVDQT